jgi:hypothetical protein
MSKSENHQRARSPPWKKKTPTNYPELQGVWENMYRELHVERGIGKSKSLQLIGDRYGVSRITIGRHICTTYKKSQKKYESKRWSIQKKDPDVREAKITYNRNYQHIRNHIDEVVTKSYRKADHEKTMTLEDLAYGIHDISSIFFKPETILRLSKRFEESKGFSLLTEISGHDGPRYALSNGLSQKS